MTLDWLRDNGLQPGVDVKLRSHDVRDGFFSPHGLASWAVATLKGAYDAIMTGTLERALLIEETGYHSLVELAEAYLGRMVHCLAAHVDTIRKEPDLVRSVVRPMWPRHKPSKKTKISVSASLDRDGVSASK